MWQREDRNAAKASGHQHPATSSSPRLRPLARVDQWSVGSLFAHSLIVSPDRSAFSRIDHDSRRMGYCMGHIPGVILGAVLLATMPESSATPPMNVFQHNLWHRAYRAQCCAT